MFSLTELVKKFTGLGAEWVMYLLVLLSIASIAVIIERILFYLARRINSDQLAGQLEQLLRNNDVQGAFKLVKGGKAIEAIVIAAGLTQFHRSATAVSEAMLSAKTRERIKYDAYLTVLATLGNNAPFVGLFGTVLGIINAAGTLADVTTTDQAASMAHIFEALAATAVGLFVAIPAVVAYNGFQRWVRTIMGKVDSLAHLLLALHKPAGAPDAKSVVMAEVKPPLPPSEPSKPPRPAGVT